VVISSNSGEGGVLNHSNIEAVLNKRQLGDSPGKRLLCQLWYTAESWFCRGVTLDWGIFDGQPWEVVRYTWLLILC